jgi:hypothetical protein
VCKKAQLSSSSTLKKLVTKREKKTSIPPKSYDSFADMHSIDKRAKRKKALHNSSPSPARQAKENRCAWVRKMRSPTD